MTTYGSAFKFNEILSQYNAYTHIFPDGFKSDQAVEAAAAAAITAS